MSWKDELRKASFRGVEFFIDSSDFSTGRRSVLHEFPNRDTPYTEDMGRISDSFEIEGYVLGDNYFQAKRNLQEVFTKKGPGELIHPYYGLKIVQVGPVSISETTKDGAIATFSAKFSEAGNNKYPKGQNDKGAILSSTVETALEETKADFDESFSIEDLPGFAVDSARDLVSLAQEQFDDVTKTFADVSDAVADLAYSTRNLVAEVNDLLQAPSVLSQRLLDSFALLEDAFTSEKSKVNALSTFYTFGKDEPQVDATTPIRQKEKNNQDKLTNFMRKVAAVKSASTAMIADYASFDDALNKRVEITAVINEQIREDDNTELYQSLIDVNAALVDALPDVDADLPRVQEITLDNTESSLTLSYDLFENDRNEQDLIDRNGVRNPGFIEAGTTLEVLNGS